MNLLSIEFLPVIFLISGLSLLAVAYAVRRQSLKLQYAITMLYEANKAVEQDALRFMETAWPILSHFGVKGVHGKIDWFGEKRVYAKAYQRKNTFNIQLKEGGIAITLVLSLNGRRGDDNSHAELLCQTFSMLLQANIAIKANQFLISQKRLEKFQLFVQHDIKNIAQFVTLVDEQIQRADTDEQKIKLCNRLKTSLPSMAKRAKKVAEPMLLNSRTFDDVEQIALREFIRDIAQVMSLSITLSGEATLTQSRLLTHQVFENILDNFKSHSRHILPVDISISKPLEGFVTVVMCMEAPEGTPEFEVERLFEPFWTTSESGMGLGLFIVRALLDKVGGEVSLQQSESRYGFSVKLKVTP